MIDRLRLYYYSPLGWLEIVSDGQALSAINFIHPVKSRRAGATKSLFNGVKKGLDSKHPFLAKCQRQLNEYFQGRRMVFDLPIKLSGTAWQNNVYQKLARVPFGSVISYKDLAILSGHSQAARAVGQAVNQNKLAIIIPCHRVVGSSGKLVGYAGGINKKVWLLEQEKAHKSC